MGGGGKQLVAFSIHGIPDEGKKQWVSSGDYFCCRGKSVEKRCYMQGGIMLSDAPKKTRNKWG